MTRTANTTRGILALLTVLGALVFAIALPVAASAAPITAGAVATEVIPCPLAATPSPTGPVPICPPPCPPPCPTPTPSDPVVCPLPAAPGASVIIRPCTVSAFQNLGTTFCLDSNGSNARNVLTTACDGARSQQWVFERSNTTTTIRDLATGLCLTSNTTGDVYAVPCINPTPTPAPHRWFVTQSGGPVIDVVTGRCLDSPPCLDHRLCPSTPASATARPSRTGPTSKSSPAGH